MNTQKSKVDFEAIHKMADAAGKAAVLALTPIPTVTTQFGGDRGESGLVPDGACGFAWVKFSGNTFWGRWAKKTGLAKPAYQKGLSIWISDYNQSLQKKEAYAQAYASKLREKGINAWVQTRMY